MNTFVRMMTACFFALCLYGGGQASPSRTVPQARAPRFIDIPAMVKSQVERALAGTEAPEESHSAVAGQEATGGRGGSLMALGIAVLFSAATTIIVLRQLGARQGSLTVVDLGSTRDAEKMAERGAAVPAPGIEEHWSPARPERAAVKTVEEERPRYDSQTFRLLQSFHRGHGELSLAMRLSSDTRGGRTQEKLQRALPQVENEDARATVARKFSMGKGEIDLAVHLNELQTSHLRKEKA